MTRRCLFTQTLSTAWVLAVLTMGGCGWDSSGQITGKVVFQGEPLPSGTVTFLGVDDKKVTGEIAPNGQYRINSVAIGDAKIAVEFHSRIPPGLMGRAHPAPGDKEPDHSDRPEKPIVLPTRYKDATTSGLSYTVKPGEQTHEIELKP